MVAGATPFAPFQRQLLLRSPAHTPVGDKDMRRFCPGMFRPEGLEDGLGNALQMDPQFRSAGSLRTGSCRAGDFTSSRASPLTEGQL